MANYFTNYIEDLKRENPTLDIKQLKSELYKNRIMIKDGLPNETVQATTELEPSTTELEPSTNEVDLSTNEVDLSTTETSPLTLVYHKYDMQSSSELEKFCRSLVIETNTFKVVSYTCPNPICNKDAQRVLINNNVEHINFQRCYEGSLLSLFHHGGKWYLSTRRCLDASKSIWNGVSHQQMFMDVLNKEGISFEEFCDTLDATRGYYFVLIHHHIKNIIDYTSLFGEHYSKLCLAFVRDSETQLEVDNYEFPQQFTHIFKSDQVSLDDFNDENKEINLNPLHEGVVSKIVLNGVEYLLKLQNLSYQFLKAQGPELNIFKGYCYLYQKGYLKQFLSNVNHKNYEKIANPYNYTEQFDTVGVIDAVFKVISSEFFELFRLLWDFKSNKHMNVEVYNLLPKEYKDILYGLRGLYFEIKKNKLLFGIKDIYNYLKSIDIEHFCALLRQRKLMFNWIILEPTNLHLQSFKSISVRCEKVQLKLTAIFINRLYPEILASDIP